MRAIGRVHICNTIKTTPCARQVGFTSRFTQKIRLVDALDKIFQLEGGCACHWQGPYLQHHKTTPCARQVGFTSRFTQKIRLVDALDKIFQEESVGVIKDAEAHLNQTDKLSKEPRPSRRIRCFFPSEAVIQVLGRNGHFCFDLAAADDGHPLGLAGQNLTI